VADDDHGMADRKVRRVVVADDDPDIVDILTFNLTTAGYEVTSAADGVEALELVRASMPDLVVLDIMMPRMDGLEALAALKGDEATKEIPVVMLTAKTSDADQWAGWEAGADYYITKPFDLDELLRFIGYLQVDTELEAT
jgi:DNA-binding response OmpR family regulator